MALTSAYLVTPKNLDSILNALLGAKAPERFTNTFLKNLGFTSSNDGLYIRMLKELGLLDENSAPTERYFRFLDPSESRKVLAEGIMEAYEDLFALRKNAYEMTIQEVKNKLKTLTQGTKDEKILQMMANTFKALSDYADWSEPSIKTPEELRSEEKTTVPNKSSKELDRNLSKINPTLHYNIQIHLPESRDIAVYDAIFRSLKEHLL